MVRWASDIVENESKMRSRQEIWSNTSGLALKPRVASLPKRVANSSMKIQSRKPEKRSGLYRDDDSGYQTSSSDHSQRPAPFPQTGAAVANISKPRQQRRIPPRVPDAPRQMSPSAPRPTRLPTPDLPDIVGNFFPSLANPKLINNFGYYHAGPAEMKLNSQREFKAESSWTLITDHHSGCRKSPYGRG